MVAGRVSLTMLLDVLPAIGGLGLFLLGMLILTEGLKGLAGGACIEF